jgi:diamine N-acetyltransferase
MIEIRQAGDGDIAALVNLNRFAQELHFMNMPQRFKPMDAEAVSGWFRSMLDNPDARVWIVESAGSPVGYVLAVTYDRPENPFCHRRRFCEIDQIAIAPGFRKKGLARALVERVLVDARSRGIRDVELNSYCFNSEAHAAFVALGFRRQTVRFSRTIS